jgi:hypothetical protein
LNSFWTVLNDRPMKRPFTKFTAQTHVHRTDLTRIQHFQSYLTIFIIINTYNGVRLFPESVAKSAFFSNKTFARSIWFIKYVTSTGFWPKWSRAFK